NMFAKPSKTWKEHCAELERILIECTIGDMNKKGSGRKENKPQAGFAAMNNAANSIMKRDRAWVSRWTGKFGRIRGTIYGKRGEKCGRTVASGDLWQDVDEVGVPNSISETLTILED